MKKPNYNGPRPRGENRKPILTAGARDGLAHVVALLESQPVPLEHAAAILAAREWIARTLAHHDSAPAVAARAANIAQKRAYERRKVAAP